ncbi:MAG: PBP1A family penicillin-binding protein [Deltaproteobacteria bacterium]|nr:PBP1A family penicillin-binding protein [Deltaproteobacteria bacterium]
MAFFRSRGVRIALILLFVSALGAASGAAGVYYLLIRDLPDFRSVADYRPPVSSVVFDRQGRLIGELYTEQRRLVPIEEIPKHVKLAFVSAEDGKFYEHEGFDFVAILRAAIANLREGGIAQGASTITQQTVKSLLLSPEKTYERKLKEILLSWRIEQALSKDEILYLYLNQIYFGNGAWGIGQAARSYFGKEAKDLTISESAMLAGLPQRPSAYDPNRDPEAAEGRRRYVLGRMLAEGHIDQATHDRELAQPPVVADHSEHENFEIAGYFSEEVRRLLYKELGQDVVLEQGLRIETTLDLDLQRVARDAVQRGLVAQDHRHGYRGPLRRIGPDEREIELDRLALANAGLAEGDATGTLDEATRAKVENVIREALAAGKPLEGLVLAVNGEKQFAKIGFGAGVEGRAALDDVKWARKPNPESGPYNVSEIDSIFDVGDVVRFVRIAGKRDGEEAGSEQIVRLDIGQTPFAQGALLSLDNKTGDVLAMIGGYDYAQSEFNRAVQAQRLPGSAFKPFIYGAALTRGYTPVSTVIDRPVVYTDPSSGFVWAPRNYGRKSYGPMTMRDALKKSINNATVYLFRDIGPSYVIEHARRFGIESKLTPDLSLALGTSAVTLLELTRAYAVYPRGGVRMAPRFIRKVVDRDGKVLLENVALGGELPPLAPLPVVAETTTAGDTTWSNTRDPDNQVLPPADAYLMCDMLQAVVREGTGAALAKHGRTFAGKTGTTNEYSDAWFVGFSPEITTGVWVGNDDNLVLGRGETGGTTALPIWGDFMKVAVAPYPNHDFEAPADIEFRRVDKVSGLLADASTQDAYFQPFRAGTAPEQTFTEQTVEKKARQVARDDAF